MQNSIGSIVTERLSEDLGTEVSIENIRFYPIKKIILNDILVKDHEKDSLLFIDQIAAPIDSIIFGKKEIYLGQITIDKLQTEITKDSIHNNYSFIMDSLLNKRSSNSKWKYHINEIKIRNSSFSYFNSTAQKSKTKFNINDIDVSKLNLHIDRINNSAKGISLRIKNFSAKEKSGLIIKKSKGQLKLDQNSFLLSNFILNARHSFFSLGKLHVEYDSTFQTQDFIEKAPIKLNVNSLSADYRDFQLFIPNFPKLQDRINLRGNFSGTIAKLKGSNININAGSNTHLETSFDIEGLPKLSDAYLFLNVKDLKTNVQDISKLFSLRRESESINLPQSFQRIGDIDFNGRISGFIDNLVAYGSFKTSLGDINTDIGIKLTEDEKLVYSGFINTQSFNIGKIVNSETNLNNVTMDVSVQGYKIGKKDFNSYIQGTIDSIDIKGYKYEKIELNGLVSNKLFDGRVNLNDPNAQLSFNGKVDFSNTIPEFNFDASISNVRLDKLNLAPNLIGSSMSMKLNSNLTGKNINSLSGNTVLHSGKIWIDNKEHLLDSLVIDAKQDQSPKEININSDLIEANLKGEFNLKTIPNLIKQIVAQHIPSLVHPQKTELNTDQFDFNIKTKKLSDLTEALTTKFKVSDGSFLNGSINGYSNEFNLKGEFDEIKYNALAAEKLSIEINADNNKLYSNIDSKVFGIENFIPLNNFNITQEVSNDSIYMNMNWNDKQEHPNRGSILSQTTIRKQKEGDIYTSINLLPSYIHVRDSLWTIQDSKINITPTGIKVNAFRVHHINQEININGSLHDDRNGVLNTYFQNINVGELTSLFNIKRLTFDGLLNGSVEIKNTLEQPIITSNLTLEKLKVNDEEVGDMNIESNWSNLQKAILINTQIEKDSLVPLNGIGYFKPSNKDFSFNFKLDSLPLSFVNLYTSKVIQDLRGTGSGELKLLKTEHGLGLDGGVKVNKAKFNVDLLQCSFFLEDSVHFTPDAIEFSNMTITDPKGRKGRFDGSITHQNFRNMYFDMYVHADNMLLLNTKEKDNPLYYGTVYADGDMAITGTLYDINLDITGETKRNTKFYIPISDDEESLDNNFIQFVSASDTTKSLELKKEEEYQVDLSNFTLNMGIEITPDAQVQVIFDPSVGNILKSWGKGNLQVQMNKEGEISFLGDYIAEKGDYLFSLENVVNKRFDINKGGTVIWEGDPYDAIIDITATYKLKTSLQPLTAATSSSGESNDITSRVPINCDLILSDRLSQPKINFNIAAPTLEKSTQNIIEEAISSEEELNRQVLSLLVLNKFYTPSYNAGNTDNTVNSANLANAYTYELLSGQLSNILSQMLNDVDVGISYRPEDEISSEQIEVALSTQMFNDRVTLNGNVEYGKYGKLNANNPNSSNIVGDFDLDVKLNKSGSLRAKAYTHSNDDFSFDNSPTTQGVGISYQEEFDTVGELISKYWNWITGKGKKEEEVSVTE